MSRMNIVKDYFLQMRSWSLVVFYAIFVVWGCKKNDPVPTYVEVNEVDFSFSGTQGTKHQKLSHLWVYADEQLLGAFPFPAKIPILCEQSTCNLRFYPGIRDNGSSDTPEIYPFLDYYSTTIPYKSGEWQTIKPVFSYNQDTRFLLMENFDFSNQFNVDLDGNPNTTHMASPDAYEGLACLKMTCDKNNPLVEVANNSLITNLPTNNTTPVYLELTYKCDLPIGIGYNLTRNGRVEKKLHAILNPRAEWNKVYINFTELFTQSGTTGVQLFFSGSFTEYTGLETQASIWIDNVKLLKF